MAFFKFRKQGDDQSPAPTQPESVETMRKRAKYRLIGAAVLVLTGVIGFPLMFDQQPRPIAVDMPIDIPDRNKVSPLAIPAPAVPIAARSEKSDAMPAKAVAAVAPVGTSESEKLTAPFEVRAQKTAETQPKPAFKLADKSVVTALPVLRSAPTGIEDAKARALSEGRDPVKDKSAVASRYVVQVGAFADAVRAREVRSKMEKVGLKTYTHVAETKDGPRVRVRVGPFDSKAEADSAAEKVRKLDLPAAILTL